MFDQYEPDNSFYPNYDCKLDTEIWVSFAAVVFFCLVGLWVMINNNLPDFFGGW